MMLGGNPAAGSNPTTNLLYTGEQFDTNLQQYYLRARYYDPSNGRFNRLDPYAGNNQDPQSLHKYLYCHANPVNGIDPSGNFTLIEAMVVIGIITIVGALLCPALHSFKEHATEHLAGRNPNDHPDAISYLGPELKKQMNRDILETSNPDLLNMKKAFYHDLGYANQVVTYQRELTEYRVIDAIDKGFHAAEYTGMALGMAAPVAGLYRTEFIWSETPHGIPEHWETIVSNVTRRATSKGDIKKVLTNKGLSTITGKPGAFKPNLQPDWAEVTASGKLRIYEVISPSQTEKQFIEKGADYKLLLGDMLEDYDYINIGGQIP
jgi:RHS repeat-associated protein